MKQNVKCHRLGTDILETMVAHYDERIESIKADVKRSRKQYPDFVERGRGEVAQLALFRKLIIDTAKKAEDGPVQIHPKELAKQVLGVGSSCGIDYTNWPLFLFQNRLYAIIGPLTGEEKKLIVCETADKERAYFERLKSRHNSSAVVEARRNRSRIPENVRIAVWRRDSGQCARCGSREKLEYDHIIPLAEGGASTVRNVELLCERCNRSKAKKIG
jgi:HNH endonuclease